MKLTHLPIAACAALLASPVLAQTASQPLSLAVPPEAAASEGPSAPKPAASPVVAANPAVPAHASATDGATSATLYPLPSAFQYDDPNPRNHAAAAAGCDDETYGKPQVHGSVGAGVAAGKRISGNYQSAVVGVTKALGSCDDPGGVVSVSVGVGKEDFHGPRHWRH